MAGEVFSDAEKLKLKILFDKIDTRGDGHITARDFKAFARDLGRHMTDERADELVSKGDPTGSGRVDFIHFCLALAVAEAKVKIVIVALAMFRELDADNSGFVTKADLRRICREAGARVPDDKLEDLINGVDKTGDDRINFKEFLLALADFARDH